MSETPKRVATTLIRSDGGTLVGLILLSIATVVPVFISGRLPKVANQPNTSLIYTTMRGLSICGQYFSNSFWGEGAEGWLWGYGSRLARRRTTRCRVKQV